MAHLPLYLLYAFAGLGLLGYLGFLAGRFFFVERFPDEIHYAVTADGWRIAASRYRPKSPNGAEPVILCHGIGTNGYDLDLTDELSLARYLSAAGYDTWAVEMRGRGRSTRPRLFSGRRYDWCFDEYVERDLPAAIEAVRRATRAERISLVGFSLGGMVVYAYLADPRRDISVRSAVAIGAPAGFRFQQKYLGGRILRSFRWLRHRFLLRLVAPLAGYWHPAPFRLIHNPENLDGPVLRRLMVNAVTNFSRNELLQISDWLLTDSFRSIDHRRDYRAELSQVDTPILFLAGARDLLATPDAVKVAYDGVASHDKRFTVCGRAQGMKANYGHIDLLLGRDAPGDIYPLVRDWLDAHAGVTRTLAPAVASSADLPPRLVGEEDGTPVSAPATTAPAGDPARV